MRVGIIGTGAISHKHVQAYRNIGYRVVACAGIDPVRGKRFADQYGCDAFEHWQDLCRHPEIDFVDVCTFPDFRLEPVGLCAREKKTHPGSEADRDQSGSRRPHAPGCP